MFWLTAALAGGLPNDLDRAVQRWRKGVPPSEAFRGVDVGPDKGLRATLEERGITHLEFIGMELELVVSSRAGDRTIRLFLDPRKPARPVVRRAEVREGGAKRAHPLISWEAHGPEVSRLAEKVYAGFLETRCPTAWKEGMLPAGLPPLVAKELAKQQTQAREEGAEVCDAALRGQLKAVMLDDVSWFAYADGLPVGVLRGELELSREGLRFRFNGLREFSR